MLTLRSMRPTTATVVPANLRTPPRTSQTVNTLTWRFDSCPAAEQVATIAASSQPVTVRFMGSICTNIADDAPGLDRGAVSLNPGVQMNDPICLTMPSQLFETHAKPWRENGPRHRAAPAQWSKVLP